MTKTEQHAIRPPTTIERLSARDRPDGSPVMHQSWDKLLFLNWEISADLVRPLIPQPLAIDTFDGKAWITITPLTIYGVRPSFLPAVPYFSWLHELNLRTYVYFDGVPGVWFFSLDANNWPAVLGARMFFGLPYFSARIGLECSDDNVSFSSERSGQEARFAASWSVGSRLPATEPNSLEFFLTERYSLYSADSEKLYRCRIHHVSWPLQECIGLSGFRSSVAEAADIPEPAGNPLHFCGGPVDVEVWPLEKVADCV